MVLIVVLLYRFVILTLDTFGNNLGPVYFNTDMWRRNLRVRTEVKR